MVKILLFVFLWLLFGSSVRAMRASFRNVPDGWRAALPAAVAVIAILVGYLIYINIKEILRFKREFDEAGK